LVMAGPQAGQSTNSVQGFDDRHNTPSVSVVIPVYDRPGMATEAVRSVLFQSYPHLECILVDDGSRKPPAEAERLFSADPRFRYKRIAHTGMAGAVRNCGVREARYDLIAFLDSDDIWLPDKLERQIGLPASSPGLEDRQDLAKNFVLIHTREVWLRGEKVISQKTQRHRRHGNVFADALEKCMIGPSTVLMRKAVFEELGGFREDLEIAEDYEFWLRLTAIHQVEYIDTPLVVKRAGHGEQLSEKYGQIEIFRLTGLHDLVRSGWFIKNCPGGGDKAEKQNSCPELVHNLAAAELARKAGIYAAGSRKRGRMEEADRYEQLARKFASSSK